MAFWSLFVMASMPVLEFLLIGLLGAFLASGYSNILSDSARRDINKVVFVVFVPAMVFTSLAKNVTLQELISWWYMPINIIITFLIGGILAWIMVKILRPEPYLESLIITTCSAGNVGNLLFIIVPAICNEDGSPFGEESICQSNALSYVSLSLALGEISVWTFGYSLMRKSGILYGKNHNNDRPPMILNKDSKVSYEALLVNILDEESPINQEASIQSSPKPAGNVATSPKPAGNVAIHEQSIPLLSGTTLGVSNMDFWDNMKGYLKRFVDELLAPPTIAAIAGLVTGVIPWLKSVIIGNNAPLRVIDDSLTTIGRAMLPCKPLILGGNLTQGLHRSALKPLVIIVIVFVRYIILPISGIAVVKAAGRLGFLPQDPLYSYVLLLQFAVPPATSIGIIAQLFDVGKEECSVIFLWTYLLASLAVTMWSTIFMGLLS